MPNHDILDLQPAHIRELQNRYERVLADHGYDSLLIASGAAPYRYRDDQAYVFQGFGSFLHWTGLAGQEHSWLLIRPSQKPVLWLYQPVSFWLVHYVMPYGFWLHVGLGQTRGHSDRLEHNNVGRIAVNGDPSILDGLLGDNELVAAVVSSED